jgi:hypothetical protein
MVPAVFTGPPAESLVKNRRARTRLAALALIAASVLTTAGCGGSSDTNGQGDSTTTKASYIKEADAICRQTDAVQKKALAEYESAHPNQVLAGAQGEKVLKTAIFPPIGVEIRRLTALEPPAGLEKELRLILRGWENALRAVDRKPKLVMGLDEGPFTRPDKLAAAFGFKDCSKAL